MAKTLKHLSVQLSVLGGLVATPLIGGEKDTVRWACTQSIVQATGDTASLATADTAVMEKVADVVETSRIAGVPDFPFLFHFVRSENAKAGKRPLLCFLPGGPGLSSQTLRSLEILTRSHDLVFIDPPETGGQQPIHWEQFPTSAIRDLYIDSFVAALEDLGRDFILVGHSFGGLIGAEAAIRFGERGLNGYKGNVFMAAPLQEHYLEELEQNIKGVRGGSNIVSARDEYNRDRSSRNFTRWVASLGELIVNPEHREELNRILDRDQSSPNSLFFLARKRHRLKGKRRREVEAQMKGMTEAEKRQAKMGGVDFFPRKLAKIRDLTPSHFIIGGRDLLFSASEQLEDAEISGGSVRLIDDGSHFIFLDELESVASSIENFSERVNSLSPQPLPTIRRRPK